MPSTLQNRFENPPACSLMNQTDNVGGNHTASVRPLLLNRSTHISSPTDCAHACNVTSDCRSWTFYDAKYSDKSVAGQCLARFDNYWDPIVDVNTSKGSVWTASESRGVWPTRV